MQSSRSLLSRLPVSHNSQRNRRDRAKEDVRWTLHEELPCTDKMVESLRFTASALCVFSQKKPPIGLVGLLVVYLGTGPFTTNNVERGRRTGTAPFQPGGAELF